MIIILSAPFRLLWWRNWKPNETILSTCATFLVLSYSKFLFVSISLLFYIRTHNCKCEVIPNSSVLLYDSSVKFLSSEHIPYVVLALSVITIFVLLPPLLLLLYPTRSFRKCLNSCGFCQWDILQLVMDIFQGWYKDGTEGTYDYRSLSALYMVLRIVLSYTYFRILVLRDPALLEIAIGLLYAFLGMMFLVFKPYKVNWINYTNGNIFLLLAFFALTYTTVNRGIYYIGIILGSSVALAFSLYLGCICIKKVTS